MKLEWSIFAIADREAIFDYIEADSPRAALAVDDAISRHVAGLVDFPLQGRPGRVDGTRELVITRLPYVVAYRVKDDVVRILRVLHGAQLWPDSFSS